MNNKKFCFVSAHLAAHIHHVDARNANFVEILNNVRIGRAKTIDFDCSFDHVFWIGDLNYRCDLRLKAEAPADAFARSVVPVAEAFPQVTLRLLPRK